MDEKLSSLELKKHLFFSANDDERKWWQQLSVKYKKGVIFTRTPKYASGLTIIRNIYSRTINPAEFCKRLDQAKQSFPKKSIKRVRKNTRFKQGGQYQGPIGFRGRWALLEKMIVLRRRELGKRTRERPECAKKTRPRTLRTRQESVPQNAQRRRSGASRKKSKADEFGGMETTEHQGRAKQACLGSPRKRTCNRHAWTASGP